MALACAKHHSSQYRASVGVQTDEAVDDHVALAAARPAATADITQLLEPPIPGTCHCRYLYIAVSSDRRRGTRTCRHQCSTSISDRVCGICNTRNRKRIRGAPSPAVSYSSFFPSFSQPNEAITDLVNPQFSIIADEASQVVGLFPLLEDNQVHQEEQIVTAVQPLVIVQETHQLPIVEWIQDTSGDQRSGSTRACDTAHLRTN